MQTPPMIQNEPVAAARTYRVFLVDNAGNPVTGVSRAAGAIVKIDKNRGGLANTVNDLVEVDSVNLKGAYDLQIDIGEVDTQGSLWTLISTGTFPTAFKDFVIDDAVEPDTGSLRYFKAAGGGANYVTADAGASATDNFYCGNGQSVVVEIVDGTGKGQSRISSTYTGATQRFNVTPNWTTNPDNTSIVRVRGYVGQLDPATITAIQATLATAAALTAAQTDITTIVDQTLRALGLLGENSIDDGGPGLDGPTFAGDNVITAARRRQFASKAAADAAGYGSADNADGEIHRWNLAATDISGGTWKKLKRTKAL